MIQLIASGVEIRQPQYHSQLKLLQETAPTLTSFILKLPFDVTVPSNVCPLICDLLDLAVVPFEQPSPSSPPPTADTRLSFFPNLPKVRGTHCYSADKQLPRSKGLENEDSCRKYSSCHPTLPPGIFTIF